MPPGRRFPTAEEYVAIDAKAAFACFCKTSTNIAGTSRQRRTQGRRRPALIADLLSGAAWSPRVRKTKAKMKRKLLLLVVLALLLVAGAFLASRDRISRSVSVVFVGYTNFDTAGFNDQYTWAWFRLENHSPFMLACLQGPLDVERAGRWLQDTNRLGHNYDRVIEPGKSLTISMMPPRDATRWRSNFLLVRMNTRSYSSARLKLAYFMDSLRLYRIGFRWRPWNTRPAVRHVVTSETLKL